MPIQTRRQFLMGRPAPAARPLARIGEGCLEPGGIVCQACRDACLPRAVRFLPLAGGTSTPAIDAARCTGCGDCVAVCPASAIILEGTAA